MAQNQPTALSAHEREYKIIKSDLLRLLALNAVYLTGMLLLYFTNQKSHFLDKWLSSILPF